MYSSRSDLKYKHLYFVNECNPGGSTSLHCYYDDLINLSPYQYEEFVDEFLGLVFEESTPKVPNHVIGIVHNAAQNLPDLLELMADDYPDLVVKRTLMGKSDVETLKLSDYRKMVHATYCNGTFRCGPLLQVSLVGATSEECGDYFPSVLDMLQSNLFVKKTLPWGDVSCLEGIEPNLSNDGPILWCRYGEQVVPTQDMPKSATPKKKGINELKNLQYLPRSGESREFLIEDRTKCHADQVGAILEKKTTAAVGILKATHASNNSQHSNRIVKEVVCIDASHFEEMVDRLKLDLHEPPMTQCISWLEGSRLNQLHRQNIKTSTIHLRDNDVYFIPRNVIHQFKTTTACTSVAWHVRLKRYHRDGGCGCGRQGDEVSDVPLVEDKGNGSKIKKSLALSAEKR
ncbi:hypothetical protein HELRODRAFT_91729 [Helobdella robusta]|uniref:Round spermatid basic protein 1-like protein n=1 Tax=Helobdella robusta TaxID=6412 RepID=T1G882_HELRO|nr:hypothetical protein HELRODRAFT_91729 [Helobdella robusta]ESO11110.1 hypothetical protein HELRODRAFT_91729 [Helobdella robusta]